jgi:glycosyltransferase involved in cell wall biosynthesis
MKLLYYHQHFSTPDGPAGTRSYEMALRLIDHGHSVIMICGSNLLANTGLKNDFTNGKREGFVNNIYVIEFDLPYSNSTSFIKRSLIFLRFSWEGIKIAFKEDYDLLFATSTPLTAGIPGLIAKLFRRKPFVFEVRDLWPELPKAMKVIKNPIILKLMDWLETFLYKTATSCIGLSPGIVNGIKNKAPYKNIAMIPNGCDLKSLDYNKKNKKFNAVFTGAHGFANGLDALLDAAKILIKENQNDIIIQFIGDGVLKKSLIKRAKEEGLSNCMFIKPMPKNILFNYLNENANVGLMILENIPAFYYGTSPNKFFDYLSLGLPVINNYPGWIKDLILKNNCGVAVEPNNPSELANSLINLKEKSDLRLKMSKNARALAEEKFDRKILGKEFVKFLESAIK